MNRGIMSGMAPVRMQEGGDASKSFMNLQRTAEGSGANLRDFTDLIFDPTDPVDYALLPLLVFPPAAIAARLIKMGVKGNKLAKSMKKVETIKDAQRSMGKKAKDLFTTDPVKNMAAANGLLLGPTRTSVIGATGQMTARNELADLGTTNERNIKRVGPAELYSYEARDQIKKNPSLVKKGGIGDLAELGEVGSDLYDIAKDPEGREAMAEVIKESLPSMPNVFGTVDDEILNRRDGGIARFAKGGAVKKGGKTFLDKTKEKIKLKKDGTPDKRSQPKTSGQKINEKIAQAKPKQTPAQKKAAAERKRQAANKKAAQQRQTDIDAKAKANADARRKADTDEFNQSRQQTPATKVDDAAPAVGVKEPPMTTGNTLRNNIITRNPGRSTIAGSAIAASMGFNPFSGDGADVSDDDGSFISDEEDFSSFENVFGGGNKGDTSLPDTNPSAWAEIMKSRIVNDRGIPLDDQGNFTTKPKFMDYLKSLPGAYSDKVQRDPDFAKKMMAGFLNMMKPVEGYVPINSAVAFGEGYLGEETRQSDMLPADAKMMEYLKSNPEMYDKYLEGKAAEAGLMLSEVKADEAQQKFIMLKDNLIQSRGIPFDKIGDYRVIYTDPRTGKRMEIDSTVVQSMGAQGVEILGRPGYDIELRP